VAVYNLVDPAPGTGQQATLEAWKVCKLAFYTLSTAQLFHPVAHFRGRSMGGIERELGEIFFTIKLSCILPRTSWYTSKEMMARGGSLLHSALFDRFTLKPLFPEIQEDVSLVQSMSVNRCVVRIILIVLQWAHGPLQGCA